MIPLEYKDWCLELLKKLVAIPSESQNEKACAEFLANFIKNTLDMQPEILSHSMNSCSVFARSNNSAAKRKLMLGGHIDTVPPVPGWKTDPYSLIEETGILRGLGVGDMKGGIAAQLTALKMLKDSGINIHADIEFIGLADEERFSDGAHAFVKQHCEDRVAKDRFFIMAEPHFSNIVIGAAGKILLEAEVYGKTGHAANPAEGINAIDCMCIFLDAIRKKYFPMFQVGTAGSLCCLKITSDWQGYVLNIPEKCSALLNKQLLPSESKETFINDLNQIYNQTVNNGTIKLSLGQPYYPSYSIPQNEKHIKSLTSFLDRQFKREVELRINNGVSDANVIYGCCGIPTVLYGPQGVQFHTANEHLLKDDLFSYIRELHDYIVDEYCNDLQSE